MKKVLFFVALLVLAFTSFSAHALGRRFALRPGRGVHGSAPSSSECATVKYFDHQRLDHFNSAEERTFRQRYLINDEEWSGQGPILLYTGNEGDIVWFCKNTGFMFELSAKLHALVVFIEHRYYGDSLPFGKVSFQDKEHLGYLNSEQALADFAVLIMEIKSAYTTDVPVIALGGSYGGMLAAWMRMKYPHIVLGSLAASAPIWWFNDLTPCNSASVTITRDFKEATPGWPDASYLCSDAVRDSWQAFRNVAQKEDGLKWLSDTFQLCTALTANQSLEGLLDWVESTWFNLAMADYPIPASFLEPLPAWPINKTCQVLSKGFNSDEELLQAVSAALGVFYNSSGQSKCYNLKEDATQELGSQGWNFQACTEMIMPMCSDGVSDMFRPEPWNLTAYAEDCKKTYDVTIQPDLIQTMYGGKNITAHSNIIFSNGLLDPWHGGGVLQSLSDSLVALTISQGAHHLDLRAPHSDDPEQVILAREKEITIIQQWLTQN